MARVDLYPRLNSSPAEAVVQTGTQSGQKVGADTFIVGGVIGTAAAPAVYNSATVSYPDSVTEVYRYYLDATLLKTVTITYTTSAKAFISGWTIA